MNNIMFSVLIPVYNVERFLKQCLDSVISQTYDNFEVILINDGSTDLSEEICKEYVRRDKRVKLYTQSNQGLLMARRRAFKEAKGDFYICLDSDDYWDLNFLESIKGVIDKTESDLVIYRYKRVCQDSKYISENRTIFKDMQIFNNKNKELLFKEIINGSELNNLVCKAIRASIIDDNTYYNQYKGLNMAEDLMQSLPLIYNAKKIVYLDKPIYNYRVNTNSITQSINLNKHKDITIVRSLVLEYMKKLNINKCENLKIFYTYYLKVIINYIIEFMNYPITKQDKKKIIYELKYTKLLNDAINYSYNYKLSLIERAILKVYKTDNYIVMHVLSTLYFKLKTIFRKLKYKIKSYL